jgi:peptidase C39-like protein
MRPPVKLDMHLVATGLILLATVAAAAEPRGGQFIGLTRFSSFSKSIGDQPAETVLTSSPIVCRIKWNQLITSWNAQMPSNSYLKVEARALYPQASTKYYTLGLWSEQPNQHPRQSVTNQLDSDGSVATDTLIMKRHCDRVQIRLTLGGTPQLKLGFFGLCFTDTEASPAPLRPNTAAWGNVLAVPERSQMAYPNGESLCSPTTVSMLLGYWSRQLKRPDLDRDVPQVALGVNDPNWPGAGNWPFNMAYAGSLPPLRAYVTRFSDVSELEDWIAAGLPVGLSVCYNKLRGIAGPPSGHLVVCVGFTSSGDVVVNDPGTRQNVRKTFPRANLIAGWAHSHNTVYLIYPEDRKPPEDRFGHWAGYHAFQ